MGREGEGEDCIHAFPSRPTGMSMLQD